MMVKTVRCLSFSLISCSLVSSTADNNLLFNPFVFAGDDKPHLLRTLYYNVRLSSVLSDSARTEDPPLPSDIILTSDPDASISYESCIKQVFVTSL